MALVGCRMVEVAGVGVGVGNTTERFLQGPMETRSCRFQLEDCS